METIVLKDKVTGSLTDSEFLQFCMENPDLHIERSNKLEIIIMSPVTTLSSYSSGAAFAELANWSRNNGRGLAFDSSTGFTLPDRSVFSPDACWLSREKWNTLSPEDKDRFAPVCPEFVIEVRSKSDDMDELMKKMELWIKNGALLAWLIDPREEVSYVFSRDKKEVRVNGFNQILKGEGPIQGFILDLSLLKI